jgi:hypothetical protein
MGPENQGTASIVPMSERLCNKGTASAGPKKQQKKGSGL